VAHVPVEWDLVTDLAEVLRLGTAKAEENVAFRRYLSEKHESEKPFQILACEIQQQVDCTACANCCRHSIVSVNQQELEDIAAFLGETVAAVTQSYTKSDPDSQLMRVLKNSDAGCVFLDQNLCMIYEARPRACREFPHIGVGSHSLGTRASSHDRWATLCPILYNAIEEHKHVTGFSNAPRERTD